MKTPVTFQSTSVYSIQTFIQKGYNKFLLSIVLTLETTILYTIGTIKMCKINQYHNLFIVENQRYITNYVKRNTSVNYLQFFVFSIFTNLTIIDN